MNSNPHLNLQKLCVGVGSVEDLETRIAGRFQRQREEGLDPVQNHTTRMMPKRGDEILGGGSLYWVIKGAMACRQRILDLRPVVGADGVSRCDIILEPLLVLTQPRPRRPFQGWRYLSAADAPPDLYETGGDVADMPDEMRRQLAELGLL